ncbi:MAG: metal ABC transporter substrate-binding protein [Rhodoferax sp.]|jgi:zinc transport system substrate-binding protein|nr:metal ABC transporter substrate-binding protein [Rhodoferax sp.]
MRTILLTLALFCPGMVLAQTATAVLASTSWVGAFARAAGATQVSVLAPPGLVHPPDYDPRPSDLLALSRASVVLVAGYEAFLPRLREALGAKAQLLTVNTTHDPQVIRKEIDVIAAILGTQVQAHAFADAYDTAWLASAARLRQRSGGHKPVVLAQRFMVSWVRLLGVEPAATFGPGPLSLEELRRLKSLAPTLIIDNAHAAPASALAEVTGARRVVLVNFPQGSEGLLEVLQHNTERLQAALTP